MGRLEQDVVTRVAHLEFALDFPLQIVVDVFGLPIAMGQMEIVDQSAIYTQREFVRAPEFPFRNQSPIMLSRAMGQKVLKCRADRRLMSYAKVFKLPQCGVIALNRLMCRFEVQRLHQLLSLV